MTTAGGSRRRPPRNLPLLTAAERARSVLRYSSSITAQDSAGSVARSSGPLALASASGFSPTWFGLLWVDSETVSVFGDFQDLRSEHLAGITSVTLHLSSMTRGCSRQPGLCHVVGLALGIQAALVPDVPLVEGKFDVLPPA